MNKRIIRRGSSIVKPTVAPDGRTYSAANCAIAISRKPTRKWTIDRLLCITCGYCVDVCPKDSLSLSTSHGLPTVTKDKEIY